MYKSEILILNSVVYKIYVLVSLTQLAGTIHKICKVWGSNPASQKKKYKVYETKIKEQNLNKINPLGFPQIKPIVQNQHP